MNSEDTISNLICVCIFLFSFILVLFAWNTRQHYEIKASQYQQQQLELQLEEIKNNFIPEKDLLQKTKKYSKPGFGRIN